MPRIIKRPVWVVSIYGGEYAEDSWERVRSVYTDKALADDAADNLNRRIERGDNGLYSLGDDPRGAIVRKSLLVDRES